MSCATLLLGSRSSDRAGREPATELRVTTVKFLRTLVCATLLTSTISLIGCTNEDGTKTSFGDIVDILGVAAVGATVGLEIANPPPSPEEACKKSGGEWSSVTHYDDSGNSTTDAVCING